MKKAGSGSACGSISQRHGSADPDQLPHQNVIDPELCLPPCQKYQCSIHIGVGSLTIADLSLTVLCQYNIHLGWARYHAGEFQCSAHNGVDSLAIADLSLTVLCEYNIHLGWSILPVFRNWIQIQIRIYRIHMFLGFSDPDLDPQSEVWLRIRFIKKKIVKKP